MIQVCFQNINSHGGAWSLRRNFVLKLKFSFSNLYLYRNQPPAWELNIPLIYFKATLRKPKVLVTLRQSQTGRKEQFTDFISEKRIQMGTLITFENRRHVGWSTSLGTHQMRARHRRLHLRLHHPAHLHPSLPTGNVIHRYTVTHRYTDERVSVAPPSIYIFL